MLAGSTDDLSNREIGERIASGGLDQGAIDGLPILQVGPNRVQPLDLIRGQFGAVLLNGRIERPTEIAVTEEILPCRHVRRRQLSSSLYLLQYLGLIDRVR